MQNKCCTSCPFIVNNDLKQCHIQIQMLFYVAFFKYIVEQKDILISAYTVAKC
jgi:RNA polymerase subunit RPABC4/transcription elongation factor Spt4